jgi:hypothetical protein
MKTNKILIALSILLFTSFNLMATAMQGNGISNSDSSKQSINIRVNKDHLVVLRAAGCENQKRVNLVLKVYSEKGNMVYATSIHKKGDVYKAYNLAKLPEGKYNFEVYKNFKKVYDKAVYKSTELVSADEGSTQMVVEEL